jgi:hypothetical protein
MIFAGELSVEGMNWMHKTGIFEAIMLLQKKNRLFL